jgi:hypothetical protein
MLRRSLLDSDLSVQTTNLISKILERDGCTVSKSNNIATEADYSAHQQVKPYTSN